MFSKAQLLLPFLLGLASADSSCSVSDAIAIAKLQTAQFPNNLGLGSSCACTILEALFSTKVLFPGSSEYTAEATHFYDLREDLSPKCIFVPETVNDVAKGVVVLDVCQSQFAIRGGGHMPVSCPRCLGKRTDLELLRLLVLQIPMEAS